MIVVIMGLGIVVTGVEAVDAGATVDEVHPENAIATISKPIKRRLNFFRMGVSLFHGQIILFHFFLIVRYDMT